MPLSALIRPPPTLSRTLSHSEVFDSPISSVRELTDMLRPRKVPNRPSVTNSETALFRKRSHSSSPESREPTTSAMIAGVLTSCPYCLYAAVYSFRTAERKPRTSGSFPLAFPSRKR